MTTSKNALILIDLQNDFIPGGTLAVNEGEQILPVINDLLTYPFDLIIATKDWHPIDHDSFALTHQKEIGEIIQLNGAHQILWPVHCVQNTKGSEFFPGWDISRINKIIYKGTQKKIDSYSAFFDNQHLHSTGLGEYLRSEGIEEVYLAGLATDYCIKYSALDAAHEGFSTFVIIDACRGVDLIPGDIQRSLNELKNAGIQLITSKSLTK